MTTQREKNKQGEGDGGKEEIWVRVKLPTGDRKEKPQKAYKGERLKDWLSRKGYKYVKGVTYRLNDVLLSTDRETGELTENPILEENALLLVEQTFQGGKR